MITLASSYVKEKRPYQPFGGALKAWRSARRELLLCGAANTGKSRCAIEKLHYCADKYKGMRGLMVRKTRKSLTQTAMVTYETKVLPQGWLGSLIRFNVTDQQYEYPNGSIIAVGGLDDPQKIMSSEWDFIYPQEAIELDQVDWESLTSRLRNHVMPYQQLLGDCNPGPANHWLKQRCDAGKTLLLDSKHEDNPACTAEDLATLDALSGVLYLRLRKGIWASSEGMVYEEEWNPALHIVNRFDIPADWPRYWVVDFGFRNPFVWQAWAESPDDELYRYHEIYKTGTLVEDHAKLIMQITQGEPPPSAIICDHNAEDRATLERYTGYSTLAANKAVSVGIQEMQARLRPNANGRAGMYFLRDSLVEVDPVLQKQSLPICSEAEFENYIWDTSNGKKVNEAPVKKFDHAKDCERYLCAYKFCPNVPLRGEEVTSTTVLIPTIAEIERIDPFAWASSHGYGDE